MQRHGKLIEKLLNCNEIELQVLADDLEVSVRTLRNDVQGLNEMLSNKELITISKGRVFISDVITFGSEIAKVWEKSDFYQYKLTKHERKAMMSLFVLYNDEYITTDYLANRLSVSRSTVASEINDIKVWFRERGLNLIAKCKKGYKIAGDEAKIRNAINVLVNMVKQEDRNGIFRALMGKAIAGRTNRDFIFQTILNYEVLYKVELTDEGFDTIENYVAIVINRAIIGKVIGETPPKRGKGLQSFSYDILDKLFQEYNISKNFSQEEVELLKDKLENCINVESNIGYKNNKVNIQMQISAFVWAVCMSFDMKEKIGIVNYEFLLKHIEWTIYHFGEDCIPKINPLCSELEKMYPNVFEHVEKYINSIENLIGKQLRRDDISFIVMHIAAALENVKAKTIPIHALLVCPKGQCTAMLLQAKIEQNFNIKVDDVIPYHRLKGYDRSNIDLIISTVPINDDKILSIQINPLLYEKDIANLNKIIEDNRLRKRSKERADKIALNRIISYVNEYNTIINQNEKDAIKQLLGQLNKRYAIDDSKSHNYKWFYEALAKERIVLDADVNNWEESVRLAGKILEMNGNSKPSYTNKMIETIKNIGPYVVFAPGIAVVHASPLDGAISLGISFVRVRKPIEFHHELNDPVRFILGISIPDEKSHLKIFFHMVRCMANMDIQEILYDAKNDTDIINIIKLYEIKYFTDE